MGSEPVTRDAANAESSTAFDTGLEAARVTLRAALFLVIAAWVAGLATILRILIFNEQYILSIIGLAAALVFLDGEKARGSIRRLADPILAAIVLLVFGYVALITPDLMSRVLRPPEILWLSIVMIAGVLEATRRKTGPVLPILVLSLIVFFVLVGTNLPDAFQTRPLHFPRDAGYLALDTNAMMGRVMVIVGTVVLPFIVFGYLLNSFGGSKFFTGLATKLVGRFRGGPAKVSVVGSAAFGMVSGSAVANVVAVGSVSIPLMSRTGYARHVAAAIEAVTSTGGQLMPPIMGASAFLMAEFLEIPYSDIVVAAILPALFFYVALFLAFDFEARRLNIEPSTPESLGLTTGGGWTRGWKYLIPVAVLLYLLFVERRTAGYASMFTVVTLMGVHVFLPPTQFIDKVRRLVKATLGAMASSTEIILLGATAGLVIGLLNKTGFASAITIQIVIISGSQVAILLILAAILSLILGMGMPTVGVYILLAILAAPSLIQLGVEPLAAHLYVLYFGMLSMITPPVAIASFAAASVAGTNPWRTSFASLRVGAGVYLVPIAFVNQPELLLIGDFGDTLIAGLRLLLAVSLFTAVFVGHALRAMPKPLRIIGAPLAIANILPLPGGQLEVLLWICAVAAAALMVVFLRGQVGAEGEAKPAAAA